MRLTTSELLAQAKAITVREPYVSAEEMGKVIHTLRGKGIWWDEIRSWFLVRGFDWSKGALQTGYTKWCLKNGVDRL